MRTLGIDGGIASIGWAALEIDESPVRVVASGVRMFDAPETDKTRMPTNAVRRLHRGQRLVLRRRRQRMAELRWLLHQHGLLSEAGRDALKLPGLDPWRLRAAALERVLTPHRC
jgi:CRISPR-associated endonuclease Csn1